MQSLTGVEATFLKGLSVALQHPAVAADQQIICRIVQICKAWRRTVQQSAACLTNVKLVKKLPTGADEAAMDIAYFARWLYLYAGTVRSIDFSLCLGYSTKPLMLHALGQGLRAAAAGHHIPSVTADQQHRSCYGAALVSMPAATGVTTEPLRLKSLTCGYDLASSLILSALPAAALTQLCLSAFRTEQLHDALGNLSSLRQLTLTCCSMGLPAGLGYFSSINKLTQLTELVLCDLRGTMGLESLPLQLRKLDLDYRGSQTDAGFVDFCLSHLTQLQQLRAKVYVHADISMSSFPQQMLELDFSCYSLVISELNITSLLQLSRLVVECQDGAQDLLLLNQLPRLQVLELGYSNSEVALAAAPAWQHLEQLAGLRIRLPCTAVQMATLMQSVWELSRLTMLSLSCYLTKAQPAEAAVVVEAGRQLGSICQPLRHLNNLKALRLQAKNWVALTPGDMLHLSKLTGLTKLYYDFGRVLDDTMVIAVMLELTGLQDLTLSRLKQVYAMPVIGKLRGLTQLDLPYQSEQHQVENLKYLTGLRKLRKLWGFESCSEVVLREFWSDLCVC